MGVQSYEFDCLQAKEDTESSLLYPGICPNIFLWLHKAISAPFVWKNWANLPEDVWV